MNWLVFKKNKIMSIIICLFFINSIVSAGTLLLIDDEEKTFESVVFENKIKYKINVPSYGKIAFTVTCAGEAGSKAKLKIKGAETGTVIENLSVGDAYTKSIYKELILSPGYHDVDLDTNGTVYFKTFKAEFLEASWDYADETIPGQIIEYTLEAMLAVSNPNQILISNGSNADDMIYSSTKNIYISPDDGITCSVFRADMEVNRLGVSWDYNGNSVFNTLGNINKNIFATELCTTDYNFMDIKDVLDLGITIYSGYSPCLAPDWLIGEKDTLKLELKGPVDWGALNNGTYYMNGINQIALNVSGFLTVYDTENGPGSPYMMRVEGVAFLKAVNEANSIAPFNYPSEIDLDCN
ncbi:hypothetical protein ACFL1T_04950 [Chlamydiota bacterium]